MQEPRAAEVISNQVNNYMPMIPQNQFFDRHVELLRFLACLEAASPREKHGDVSWVVSTLRSPVPVSLYAVIGFAVQAKLILVVSIRSSHSPF